MFTHTPFFFYFKFPLSTIIQDLSFDPVVRRHLLYISFHKYTDIFKKVTCLKLVEAIFAPRNTGLAL